MGFLDLFRRDEVVGSRVLVCRLGSRFEELVSADSLTYTRFYPSTTTSSFRSTQELLEGLSRQYDIVHLFCDVLPNGTIRGDGNDDEVTGTAVLEECCKSNVKLLWLASDNDADLYIRGFNARGKRINLVMTMDRNGSRFSDFLDKLLFRMFYGDPMPVAWTDLIPQVPDHAVHRDLPACIFFAGRGRVRLR